MTEPDPAARQQAIKRLKAKRDLRGLLGTAAGVLAICVAIWAIAGGGYFWPIWPALGLGIAIASSAWGVYGPRSSTITEEEIEREIGRQ